MLVFEDGTCEMVIQEQTPKFQPVKFNDLTPPNPRPKGVFTKIERSGKAQVFDKDHKLIQTFMMNQKPNLSVWVDVIKKIRLRKQGRRWFLIFLAIKWVA
ncbi:MAG: hypothetical protein HC817_12610 [Saprospiraceae bacterium]|nr:hypothetical protein [Saprospiraceae bacterium]